MKAPLVYRRGYDNAWVDGARRIREGQVLTQTAPARTSAGDRALLRGIEQDTPVGDLELITDQLARHTSGPIRDWLAAHPRVQQVFLPVGACWRHLIEAWWRRLRRAAYAGHCFANRAEIARATRVATGQLNRHTHPWVWGRPPPPHRMLRRRFIYHC
jgi:hypothetical protein